MKATLLIQTLIQLVGKYGDCDVDLAVHDGVGTIGGTINTVIGDKESFTITDYAAPGAAQVDLGPSTQMLLVDPVRFGRKLMDFVGEYLYATSPYNHLSLSQKAELGRQMLDQIEPIAFSALLTSSPEITDEITCSRICREIVLKVREQELKDIEAKRLQ